MFLIVLKVFSQYHEKESDRLSIAYILFAAFNLKTNCRIIRSLCLIVQIVQCNNFARITDWNLFFFEGWGVDKINNERQIKRQMVEKNIEKG